MRQTNRKPKSKLNDAPHNHPGPAWGNSAAIQVLCRKLEEREALLREQLDGKDAEIQSLKQLNQSLERRLSELEALVQKHSHRDG